MKQLLLDFRLLYHSTQNKEKFVEAFFMKYNALLSFQKSALNREPGRIRYISNPSVEQQLFAVSRSPKSIRDISVTPDERVCIAAIMFGNNDDSVFWSFIGSGRVPSEKVQIAAISKDVIFFYSLLNSGIIPTQLVQLYAIKKCSSIIYFILSKGIVPSEQVQMAAIKQEPFGLQILIKHDIIPSDNVQLQAIKQSAYVILCLLEAGILPSEKVQLAAVQRDKTVLNLLSDFNIKVSHSVRMAAEERSNSASTIPKVKEKQINKSKKSDNLKRYKYKTNISKTSISHFHQVFRLPHELQEKILDGFFEEVQSLRDFKKQIKSKT